MPRARLTWAHAIAAMHLTLTRLYLAHIATGDTVVAALIDCYPGLEVLDVEGTVVADPDAHAIAGIAGPHALHLAAMRITDDGGAALGALSQLEIAALGNAHVGARIRAALRQRPLH